MTPGDVLALAVAAAGCGGGSLAARARRTGDIHEIRHVIVIMEENRSFDSFFGTYPHADGIPHEDTDGRRCACRTGSAAASGRSSTRTAQTTPEARTGRSPGSSDVNGGRMDGFIRVSDGTLIRQLSAQSADLRRASTSAARTS